MLPWHFRETGGICPLADAPRRGNTEERQAQSREQRKHSSDNRHSGKPSGSTQVPLTPRDARQYWTLVSATGEGVWFMPRTERPSTLLTLYSAEHSPPNKGLSGLTFQSCQDWKAWAKGTQMQQSSLAEQPDTYPDEAVIQPHWLLCISKSFPELPEHHQGGCSIPVIASIFRTHVYRNGRKIQNKT